MQSAVCTTSAARCSIRTTQPTFNSSSLSALLRHHVTFSKQSRTYATEESRRSSQQLDVMESQLDEIKLQRAHGPASLANTEDAYAPKEARTWQKLQWVGSSNFVWENTSASQSIQRWAPGQAIPLKELESHLYCSLVESLLLFDGQHESTVDLSNLPIHDRSNRNAFPKSISIGRDETGNPKLKIDEAQRARMLNALNGPVEDSSASQLYAAPAKTKSSSSPSTTSKSWLNIPLTPLSLRFVFLKRLFQRTGHRLPDSKLSACDTVANVKRELLSQQAQKRKLAQVLQDDNEGFGLRTRANVALKGSRVSKVDRDVSLGRWKLTREALRKAGLPEFFKEPRMSDRKRNTVIFNSNAQQALIEEEEDQGRPW